MGSVRKSFTKFYEATRDLIIPGLRNSQFAYLEVLKKYVREDCRWLDLGCGHQLLPEWLPDAEADTLELKNRAKIVAGIDYDLPSLRKHTGLGCKVRGDLNALPFRDGAFDLLTANMVVEHIEDPVVTLSEINRVLAPGGFFIFHTPNLNNYQIIVAYFTPEMIKKKLIKFLENREEEDIFPTFYNLNKTKTIRRVSEEKGFTVHEIKMHNSSPKTIMLGPVIIGELLLLRALSLKPLANLRSNIIAVLQKKGP